MNTKLYVGNLPFSTTEVDIEKLFGQYGEIKEIRLITDRETGRSKGFGFVTFSSSTEAEKAAQKTNGQELSGRTIKVNEAKEKESRRGGNNSRYRG